MKRFFSLPAWVACMLFTVLLPADATARVLELVDQEVDVSLRFLDQLAISPDGRFVYAGSRDATYRFRRHADTGQLTFDGSAYGAEAIAISPDGRSLYSSRYGVVRAHQRDLENGFQSLVEEWPSSPAFGVHGHPESFRLGPGGDQIYISFGDGIAVFDRDPENSALTWIQTLDAEPDDFPAASDLIFSADGRHVYGISEPQFGPHRVVVFSRDISTGTLARRQRLTDEMIPGLENVHELIISNDGRNVYGSSPNGVLVLRRDPADGTLSPLQTLGSAGTLLLGPDDRFVYAFRPFFVDIYSRGAEAGALELVQTLEQPVLPRRPTPNIASGLFSPDGRHLYLISDYDSPFHGGIEVLARNPDTGVLSIIASYIDDVEGDADRIDRSEAIVASPDGKHLYVGASDESLEIAAFSRSAETGVLSYLDAFTSRPAEAGYRRAVDLTMSGDGRALYVSSQAGSEESLVVLARDELSGALTLMESYPADGAFGLETIRAMVVSPDQRHLYVSGSTGGTLVIFERDPSSGGLTHLQTLADVPELESAGVIGLDPEGRHLYVALEHPRYAISIFARDADTGGLAFLETLDSPSFYSRSAFEMSPDGRHVYVGSGRLVVFARDPASGRLTFIEEHPYTSARPHSDPDGNYLYTFDSSSVASVYRRDPSTGRLTLIESEGPSSFNGSFNGSTGSVLSPDGDFFYANVSSLEHHAIHIYRVAEGPCRAGWDGLCLGGDRFRVALDWRDAEGTTGTATPLAESFGDSGILWFFRPGNWEMQLKVLDACELNDRFWVFAASATQVEYSLRITDMITGTIKTYFNPLGNAAAAIADTDAFATCSGSDTASATITPAAGRSSFVDLSASTALDLAAGSPMTRGAFQRTPDLSLGKYHQPGMVKGLAGKCLDVEQADPSDGSAVILYDCHGGANQVWRNEQYCPYSCLDFFSLRVFGDKCLQPGPDTGSGPRRLEIGPCGNDESYWYQPGHFPSHSSLVHRETGLCADVLGAETANRTPVVLHECHGGDNQQWAFDELACVSSPTGACKNGDRFLVEVDWRDFDGNVGKGRVLPQGSDETGLFWFFGPDNLEMLVKVLDGCGLNQQHWVLAAATTNVEYTLRVTDTLTREVREYFNPLGNTAPALTDTSAFSCAAP